jgi:general secretion pathway protein B
MPSSPPPERPAETPATRPRAVSRPQPAETAANKERETPGNSANGSAARLRVSGIVWQEERSARRAFINGNIASEGSVIDGARIMEIYPGRIRFSREGKWFDVPLEKNP